MRVHILGVCGTFMAGIAALARELGDEVSGSDANVYPPMSDQLAALGVEVYEGYTAHNLERAQPDMVIVGNAMTRGIPAVEQLLEGSLPFTSAPQWLAERVLRGRPVVALAGTHGKTTTTSMLACVLDRVGLAPGFMIGGVCAEFEHSARLGAPGAPFVVEADEYDSAFFDKRSKFIHYRPRVLAISSIEFDHADIFDDIAAIRRQFHHVIRTMPASGRLLAAAGDANIDATLEQGCWSVLQRFGDEQSAHWRIESEHADWSRFGIFAGDNSGAIGTIDWPLIGRHNAMNALAAVAAADYFDVPIGQACEALSAFRGVRRRLELRGTAAGVHVYDDFAHHPTAIRTTLEGFIAQAARSGTSGRTIAIVDLASNTMRMGVHADTLAAALEGADLCWLHAPEDTDWEVDAVRRAAAMPVHIDASPAHIAMAVARVARAGDRVLVMSNGGFGGIHDRLLAALESTIS